MKEFARALSLGLLLIGVAQFLPAPPQPGVPELDGAAAANLLCLLAGAVLVIKARRR